MWLGNNLSKPVHYYLVKNRRCDLWHHMFTQKPQTLDFLQAWFVHSSMEENMKSYMLWRLHCLILINFWYDERGPHLKTCPAFTFITQIYVETTTQNVNFPLWPEQYLACQKIQRMCKVTLIVNKVHMVYTVWNLKTNGSFQSQCSSHKRFTYGCTNKFTN